MKQFVASLRAIRASFDDAKSRTVQNTEELMTSLSENAGKVLFELIRDQSLSLKGLPSEFERPPVVEHVDVVEKPEGTKTIREEEELYYIYWLAFLGWASSQASIPVTTSEHATSRTLEEFCKLSDLRFCTAYGSNPAESDRIWPEVCRSSIQALDFLLGKLDELVDPIPVAKIVEVVGHDAGRSDHLSNKLRQEGYPLRKVRGKWHCQRADAIAYFSRKHREKIEEI